MFSQVAEKSNKLTAVGCAGSFYNILNYFCPTLRIRFVTCAKK